SRDHLNSQRVPRLRIRHQRDRPVQAVPSMLAALTDLDRRCWRLLAGRVVGLGLLGHGDSGLDPRPRPFGLIAEKEPGLHGAGHPRTPPRSRPKPAYVAPFRAAAVGQAGRQSPGPSGRQPRINEAGPREPHAWLANAGWSGWRSGSATLTW